MIDIGKMRYVRKSKGISQNEIANKIGIKPQNISMWETGKKAIPPKYHHQICSILGVDLAEITKKDYGFKTSFKSGDLYSIINGLGHFKGYRISQCEDKEELKFWKSVYGALNRRKKTNSLMSFLEWLSQRMEILEFHPEVSYKNKLWCLGVTDDLAKAIKKYCIEHNRPIPEEMLSSRLIHQKYLNAILPYIEGKLPISQREYYKNDDFQKIFDIHEWLEFRNIVIDCLKDFSFRQSQEAEFEKVIRGDPDAKFEKTGELKEVPAISLGQAKGYEPALEPVDHYARNCSDVTEVFGSEIKTGYFALRIDSDSEAPEFSRGTNLLVAGGEFPRRGDVVVAKLRDGQVVIKRYYRSNNLIILESESAKGKSFEWHCKEDPGYLLWMFPVVEVNVKLR